MKKILVLLTVISLLSISAFADQADDLIATLNDSDRARLSSEIAYAYLTNRKGGPYKFSLEINGDSVDFVFSQDEFDKLLAWKDGKYEAPGNTDSTRGKDMSDLMKMNQWKLDHGYDFPIYGSTMADLSPISDYLSILADNRIYLKLPELVITHKEDCEWIYSKVGDFFYLTYVYYNDMSRYSLDLEVPLTYRPRDEALTLLLVSMLDMNYEDAAELYGRLQYNVIDNWCVMETDKYNVSYYEPRVKNGELAGFVSLGIEKKLK